MPKITRKFYVGSSTVANSDWGHTTLEAAIQHAKSLCEENDTEQIVVQIVRRVKPANRPVIVEKV